MFLNISETSKYPPAPPPPRKGIMICEKAYEAGKILTICQGCTQGWDSKRNINNVLNQDNQEYTNE